MNTDNLWVAEYSQSQDAVHRQPLADSLRNNLRRAAKKEPNDYVILAIGSQEYVSSVNQKLREVQKCLKQKA